MKKRFERNLSGRDIAHFSIAIVFSAILMSAAFMSEGFNGLLPFLTACIILMAGMTIALRFSMRNKMVILDDLVFIPGVAFMNKEIAIKPPYDLDLISTSGSAFGRIHFHGSNIAAIDEIDAGSIDTSFWRTFWFVEGSPKTLLKITFTRPVLRLMPPKSSPLRPISEMQWRKRPSDFKEIYVSLRDTASAKAALEAIAESSISL